MALYTWYSKGVKSGEFGGHCIADEVGTVGDDVVLRDLRRMNEALSCRTNGWTDGQTDVDSKTVRMHSQSQGRTSYLAPFRDMAD